MIATTTIITFLVTMSTNRTTSPTRIKTKTIAYIATTGSTKRITGAGAQP